MNRLLYSSPILLSLVWLIATLISLQPSVFVQCQTYISTTDTFGDLILEIAGSPYIFDTTVHIVHGTLIVNPGVQARFNPGCSLTVEELLVNGTESQPILFTSVNEGSSPSNDDWKGLYVNAGAYVNYLTVEYATTENDAVLKFSDGVGMYNSVVRNTNGVAVSATCNTAGTSFVFRNNHVEAGNANALNLFGVGSAAYNIDLTDNTIIGTLAGVNINASLVCSISLNTISGEQALVLLGGTTQITVVENELQGTVESIRYELNCPDSESDVSIQDNILIGRFVFSGGVCTSLGVTSLSLTIHQGDCVASIAQNTIKDTISLEPVFTYTSTITSVTITGNTITNCQTQDSAKELFGLSVLNGMQVVVENNLLHNNQAGVAVKFYGIEPVLPINEFKYNNITYFTGGTVFNFQGDRWTVENNILFSNNVVYLVQTSTHFQEISIPGTYWGTNDETEIRTGMNDALTDPNKALVYFSPYRTEYGDLVVENNTRIIAENQVWVSPNHVYESLFIMRSQKLSIQANVTFGDSVEIRCNGIIEIIGLNEPIHLTASDNAWSGIKLLKQAEPLLLTYQQNFISGSMISNTIIDKIDVSLITLLGSSSIFIEESQITLTTKVIDCVDTNNVGPHVILDSHFIIQSASSFIALLGEIYIKGSTFEADTGLVITKGSMAVIEGNEFRIPYSVALTISDPLLTIRVRTNKFINCQTGVRLENINSDALIQIQSNEFNESAIAFDYSGSDDQCNSVSYYIEFESNTFYNSENQGSDLLILQATAAAQVLSSTACTLRIMYNDFRRADATNALIRVQAVGAWIGQNNFTAAEGSPIALKYELTMEYPTLDFQSNYFQTIDRSLIEAVIIDGSDNPTLALVNYNPVYDPLKELFFDFEKDCHLYDEDCVAYNCTDITCPAKGFCYRDGVCACLDGFGGEFCDPLFNISLSYNSSVGACEDSVIQATLVFGPTSITSFNCSWQLTGNSNSPSLMDYLADQSASNVIIPRYLLEFGADYPILVTCEYLGATLEETAYLEVVKPSIIIEGQEETTQSSEISLTFSMDIAPCASFQYSWIVFLEDTPAGYSANGEVFDFPLGLSYAQYRVQLFAIESGRSISANHTVTVRAKPTVSIAPTSNYVPLGTNLTLYATGFDPDNIGDQGRYEWSCYGSSASCRFAINSTSSYVFVPDRIGTYNISVTFYTMLGASAVEFVTIQVLDANSRIPNVTIISQVPSKISVSQKLVVEAKVEAGSERTNQSWSLTSNGGPDILGQNTLLTSTRSRILSFVPSALVIGPVYTLSFRASFINETSFSTAEISFTVAPAVSGGSFTILPLSGTELDTVYTFRAENWITDPSALPLRYSFEYRDNRGRYVPYRLTQSSSIFSTQLVANPSNTTQIRLRVQNKFGSEVFVAQNITVYAKRIEGTQQLLNQLLTDLTSENAYNLIIAATIAVREVKTSSAIATVLNALGSLNNSDVTLDQISQQSEVLSITLQDPTILDIDTTLQSIELTNVVISSAIGLQVDYDASQTIGSIISNVALANSSERISEECTRALGGLSSLMLESVVSGENATTLITPSFTLSLVKSLAADLAEEYGLTSGSVAVIAPRMSRFANDTTNIVSTELLQFNTTESALWSSRTDNVTSSIVSFKMLDSAGQKYPLEFAENNPLVVILTRTLYAPNDTVVCKYLDDYTSTERWSTRGCKLHLATEREIICHCNHTTSFAAFTQFTRADGAVDASILQKVVYYVSVCIYSIYLLFSIALLVVLVICHKTRPVSSRLFAPYICLLAIIVECTLLVIRNGLWLAKNPNIDAINTVGYVILFVANPLSIVSLFIFMWQMIRFVLLQNATRIMSVDMGSLNSERKLKFYRIFASKTVFVVLSIVIYATALVYFLTYSVAAMSLQSKVTEKVADANTITLAVSYSVIVILIGIGIVLAFLFDCLIVPIFQRQLRKKQQAAKRSAALEEQVLQESDEEDSRLKKDEYVQQITNPLKAHFTTEDPLAFRFNSIIMVLSIVIMFVSYSIGIANHVSLDRSDSSPIMVVSLALDLIYTLLRIIAYGGLVAVYGVVYMVTTNTYSNIYGEFVESKQKQATKFSTVSDDQELNIINLIEAVINNKYGYEIFKEYCTMEMSVENLYAWSTLKAMNLEWLVTSNEGRREMMESLVNKYVRSNAPYECNIPSSIRKLVIALLKDLDNTPVNEQMHALHRLTISMLTNLSDTFSRFTETPEYQYFLEFFSMHKVLEDILADEQPKIQWFSYELVQT